VNSRRVPTHREWFPGKNRRRSLNRSSFFGSSSTVPRRCKVPTRQRQGPALHTQMERLSQSLAYTRDAVFTPSKETGNRVNLGELASPDRCPVFENCACGQALRGEMPGIPPTNSDVLPAVAEGWLHPIHWKRSAAHPRHGCNRPQHMTLRGSCRPPRVRVKSYILGTTTP